MRLLGIGEILWDVFPDAERLGGAVFNLCAHAARLGHDVALVSGVGADARGLEALTQAALLGVSPEFIRTVADQPTGIVTVAVDSEGQPSYHIHRPAAYDFAQYSPGEFEPDWICFGTLFAMNPGARALLDSIVAGYPLAHRFYDVNLRKDSYTRELVDHLLSVANVVKLNEAEMEYVAQGADVRSLAARLGLDALCVTRGERGCSLVVGGEVVEAAAPPVQVADTVGAGDAFSAALIHAFDAGWPPRQAAEFANRLGAYVASCRGAVPDWSIETLAPPS